MISAATRTLASLIVKNDEGSPIDENALSFDHPQVQHSVKPNVNLYCYYLQPSDCYVHEQKAPTELETSSLEASSEQWFDLAFLVSATDHTVLGEQHLLSEVLSILAQHKFVPEQYLAPAVRGKGQIPIQISSISRVDPFKLWQVLQVPLQLSLHVTLTVPFTPDFGLTPFTRVDQAAC